MYVNQRYRLLPTLAWTSHAIPVMAIWSAGLTALHVHAGQEWLQMPAMPVGVLGTAVAFYLGFKGNASYDRLWEARKIWGGIVNSSRTWGVFVRTMVSDLHRDQPGERPLIDEHRALIYRHLAWLAALRIQLRRRKTWEHQEARDDRYRKALGTLDTSDSTLRKLIEPLIPAAEVETVMAQQNRATQLIRLQGEHLQAAYADGRIEDFRHMELARLLGEFFTLQGKAERIKNFPLPRQYASANVWFVMVFVALLPLALLGSFHVEGLPHVYAWAAVPVSVVVGWVFYTWNLVQTYSENPFEGLINDIPMTALSRTIERDLREMLGETELPPPIAPVDGLILV